MGFEEIDALVRRANPVPDPRALAPVPPLLSAGDVPRRTAMQIEDLTEMMNDSSGETTTTAIQRDGWHGKRRPFAIAAVTALVVVALIAVTAISGGDDSNTADAGTTPVGLADAPRSPADDGSSAGRLGVDAEDTMNGGRVTVIAQDHFRFDAFSYETQAGKVTFQYVNGGDLFHSLRIQGVDGFRLVVEERGEIARGTVDLEAGSYTLVCDIDAHTGFGMHAQLEVS